MQTPETRRCEPRSGEAILCARDPHALCEGSGRRFIFSYILKKLIWLSFNPCQSAAAGIYSCFFNVSTFGSLPTQELQVKKVFIFQ